MTRPWLRRVEDVPLPGDQLPRNRVLAPSPRDWRLWREQPADPPEEAFDDDEA